MKHYPKIFILAQGGTHGDFLHRCCKVMVEGTLPNVMPSGRTPEISVFKKYNYENYHAGQKKDIEYTGNEEFVVAHIWHEEYLDWPSKFYYIDFLDEHIDTIIQMLLEKVYNNNKDDLMRPIIDKLPVDLAKKINKENYYQTLITSYKTSRKKFALQTNATRILMTDLYKFDKVVDIMKHMEIYNSSYHHILKEFHTNWVHNNGKFIKILTSKAK